MIVIKVLAWAAVVSIVVFVIHMSYLAYTGVNIFQ